MTSNAAPQEIPLTIKDTLPHPSAKPEPRTVPEGPAVRAVLLDRYEVLGHLGQGAMGEVLHVRDRRSGVAYALKRVPRELMRDAAVAQAIQANFVLVSRLTHPHIANTRFFETDPATGEAYLIMDLVKGANFEAWHQRKRKELGGADKPLPLNVVLGIAEQIAAALDYAHQLPTGNSGGSGARKVHGILHRDLKPANVMVEEGREYAPGVPFVKLVDFGLASEVQASMLGMSLDRPNKWFAGTPAYMAPEQWEGRTLTPGVDQWALAVLMYEMAAGRKPFEATTERGLYEFVKKGEVKAPGALPSLVWRALKKAFEPDRRKRHGSCGALVREMKPAPATPSTYRGEPVDWWAIVCMPFSFALGLVLLSIGLNFGSWAVQKVKDWISPPPPPIWLDPHKRIDFSGLKGLDDKTGLLKDWDKRYGLPGEMKTGSQAEEVIKARKPWEPAPAKQPTLLERIKELEKKNSDAQVPATNGQDGSAPGAAQP
ncbi:MAG: serine/threonine protein kinase [Planctomycetes bacterium]|nr:serine/threonine protein kinase [Planctomycetota bacterium]